MNQVKFEEYVTHSRTKLGNQTRESNSGIKLGNQTRNQKQNVAFQLSRSSSFLPRYRQQKFSNRNQSSGPPNSPDPPKSWPTKICGHTQLPKLRSSSEIEIKPTHRAQSNPNRNRNSNRNPNPNRSPNPNPNPKPRPNLRKAKKLDCSSLKIDHTLGFMQVQNQKLVQMDWEDLGEIDPLWAVLSSPEKRHGQWQEDDFYQTGKVFISELMKQGEQLRIPLQTQRALDFGCGTGRLSFALADFFDEVIGVDLSISMLEKAKQHQQKKPQSNCHFVHNNEAHLKQFQSNSFDFVGTYIVLQHIPNKEIIQNYVREFVRILKPGGFLFFQIPTHVPMKNRVQLKRRAYTALRSVGFSVETLYSKLKLHPIYYNFVKREQIDQMLEECEILKVDHKICEPSHVISSTYYVTKPKAT